jgi:hypothetical protein
VLGDAGLVYLHQVAPKGIEKHLRPVNQTLGKFDDADTEPPPAEALEQVNGPTAVLGALGGGGRPARFEQWLQSIDGTVDRTLYFKHILLPHIPWQYLPDGRVYMQSGTEPIPGMVGPESFSDPWLLQQGYQRHMLQAAYSDRLLGQLIARLKQQGIYDKALIVVTADNGESFLHAGHDRHIADSETFTDIASTPLLIKRPYQRRGGYDDRHVRTFDVVPTMADAVGISMPWKVMGRSIFTSPVPEQVDVYREQGLKGGIYSLGLTAYEGVRRAALAQKIALFGSNGRGPGLFGIGPNRELIGRSVAELSPSGTGPYRGTLKPEVSDALDKVDTRSSFVPAAITGTIDGAGADRGMPLALALNGKIAAVGSSLKVDGDDRVWFSFLAPPDAFRDGANDVQVFTVAGSGTAPRLARVA